MARARGAARAAASSCWHGGASFAAIGADFTRPQRRQEVVAADVLDAWFSPAPRLVAAMRELLPWLLRAAPPAGAEGLVAAIAAARGVDRASILVGAGSSALIFLALPRWLPRGGRLLVLDPSYGEYAHVASTLCGATVERLALDPRRGFRLDLTELARRVRRGIDVVVLVRPNNPTGSVVARAELEAFLAELPRRVVAWIDEAYVDYLGEEESLERFAATRSNVVVCKSLSKVYALAGARAACLIAAPARLAPLRPLLPPWAVSLPAQFAAVRALDESAWYRARWRETPGRRAELHAALSAACGAAVEVRDALPNALLLRLPARSMRGEELVARCAADNVFVRDLRSMGAALSERWVRVSVVARAQQQRLVAALATALAAAAGGDRQRRGLAPCSAAPASNTSGTQQQTRLRSP